MKRVKLANRLYSTHEKGSTLFIEDLSVESFAYIDGSRVHGILTYGSTRALTCPLPRAGGINLKGTLSGYWDRFFTTQTHSSRSSLSSTKQKIAVMRDIFLSKTRSNIASRPFFEIVIRKGSESRIMAASLIEEKVMNVYVILRFLGCSVRAGWDYALKKKRSQNLL